MRTLGEGDITDVIGVFIFAELIFLTDYSWSIDHSEKRIGWEDAKQASPVETCLGKHWLTLNQRVLYIWGDCCTAAGRLHVCCRDT